MFSKTSIQVINACLELAKLDKDTYEGAASIAQRIKAPKNYLGKMLQSLASRGLVISQKGAGGGFRLAKHPKKITLFDIVEPIDNIGVWNECVLGFKKCSDDKPCVLHSRWKKIRHVYYDFLEKTTLHDLTK